MAEERSLLDFLSEQSAREQGAGGGGGTSAPGTSPHSDPRPQLVTVPPMGAVYPFIQHPLFAPYERGFRKQPDANFYVKKPSGFTFQVAVIEAPKNYTLIITGYKVELARLSGVSAGDTVPLEPGRLSTCLGFDLRLSGARERDCQYELQPTPILTGRQPSATFPGVGRAGPTSYYARESAGQYGVPGGAGKALLPYREERYGPPQGPFTIPVREGRTLDFSCMIFKPLPIPLAYVGVNFTGYQMPSTLFDAFMRQITP